MATPTVPTPDPTVTAQRVTDRTICVFLRRGKLGITRKALAVRADRQRPFVIPGGTVVTDADPKLVKVTKQLLNCPELKAISGLDFAAREYLESHCLPSMFKRGIWLLPIDLLDQVDAQLQAFKAERAALTEAFLAVYEERAREMRGQLGGLYNAADYSGAEAARRFFYFDWQYTTFDVPQRLRALRRDLFQREQAKMEQRLVAASEEIQAGLRTAFAKLVQHMADALQPTREDGRKRKFHASTLEKIQQFLDLFQSRNITDDAELARFVEQTRDLLSGVDAEWLRSDDDLRTTMAEAFTDLEGQLAAVVQVAPRRAFDLEADEGEEAAS